MGFGGGAPLGGFGGGFGAPLGGAPLGGFGAPMGGGFGAPMGGFGFGGIQQPMIRPAYAQPGQRTLSPRYGNGSISGSITMPATTMAAPTTYAQPVSYGANYGTSLGGYGGRG